MRSPVRINDRRSRILPGPTTGQGFAVTVVTVGVHAANLWIVVFCGQRVGLYRIFAQQVVRFGQRLRILV